MVSSDLRRLAVILHDLCMVAVAWLVVVWLVDDHTTQAMIKITVLSTLPWILLAQSLFFSLYGLYRGLWRFASLPDLSHIIQASVMGCLTLMLLLYFKPDLIHLNVTDLIYYPFILTFLLGTPRLFYRLLREHSFHFLLPSKQEQRVLILGAGQAGEMLARDIVRNRQYIPIGFLDDNRRLRGAKVRGLPVLGQLQQLNDIIDKHMVDLLFIAMPSAQDEQIQRVIEACENSKLPFKILSDPHLHAGKDSLIQLRQVSIDDLLGREKIQLNWQLISAGLANKTILITGAGGSIGAELCYQIARLQPQSLIAFERCEFNLYQIDRWLRQSFPDLRLHIFLGDVCDPQAVNHVIEYYQPQVVFHAAAYKHVPLLQGQIRAAVRNNILGSKILADAAINRCESFVLISTDKAVNPTNIMGACKRSAELYIQSLTGKSSTRFTTVRFGNVLGSAGSVIPLFQEQIQHGGPVTVTHPDICRYFMTIPEACQLILQAGSMGQGGEIFVLDMGTPVKIRYLAEQLIKLSGKEPEKDIKIIYTGLRSGEKLYEELFHPDEETFSRTSHSKIMQAIHRPHDSRELIEKIEQLQHHCAVYDEAAITAWLQTVVPEFHNMTT